MTITGDLREFVSGNGKSTDVPPTEAGTHAAAAKESPLPFEGYEGLEARQVMDQLAGHSQEELEAVEDYERSNKNRPDVLNKLRYMRGNEPMPGYDSLDPREITSRLADADMTTIKKVRAYERKFANRSDVLDEVERMFHERLATEPARVMPSFDAVPASALKDRGTKQDAGERA